MCNKLINDILLLLENPEVRGFADYNTLKDLCKIKEDLINPFSKGKIEKPDFGDDINCTS